MKKFISVTLNELFNANILDDQVKYEYLKYNIRKYTINFSKKLDENYVYNIDYKVFRQQIDEIYKEKAKGVKIRSKCNW